MTRSHAGLRRARGLASSSLRRSSTTSQRKVAARARELGDEEVLHYISA